MEGYPSLQAPVEFDRVEDAVRILDQMVLRLRHMELHVRAVAGQLEHLPFRRSARLQCDMAIATLIREADKTADTLSVYGFGDGLS